MGSISWYLWLGISAVIGFHIANLLMIVSKRKKLPKLRKAHAWVAGISLTLATVHGVYILFFH